MATVTKDFKVKSGLIVEGATATVNNYDILTKKAEDQSYIVDLIGGTATPNNTADSVVKRDSNGNFEAGVITADVIGDVTGTVSTLSNHTTNDLTEGSNLYFTNQRAVTANEGLWDEAGAATAAYNNAVTAAANDATSKMQQAESYADQSALDAQNAAESYADSIVATEVTNRNNAISTAISTEVTDRDNAISTAITNLNLAGTYDALGAAATAESNANAYTDTAVANLVDQAPAMLDTLNELAAAIADNPNYATDVANLVATKADTSYVDSEITGANTYAQTQASNAENSAKAYADTVALSAKTDAKSYADSLAVNYDAFGSATTAYNNATDYTDSAIASEVTNRNNAIDSAISNVNLTIDNLNTDGVDEGIGNLYFTDARAKDSAAALLTTATLTNLTITGTGNGGLVITAENGVADSTTDDLDEGTNNLYFTNARAVSALEAVVPNFTEIDLNDIVTKVATQVSVPTASQITAHEFDSTVYRSAEYTVKVAYGSHSELSKVMLTLDSSNNIAITEYAVVGTNGSASTVTADINAGNVRLRVTPTNNNSVVTVFGTIIK